MHQLGKLTKNVVVLDSCNDNKRLSISIFLFIERHKSCLKHVWNKPCCKG